MKCNGYELHASDVDLSDQTTHYSIISNLPQNEYDWAFVRGLEIVGGANIGTVAEIEIESYDDYRNKKLTAFADVLDRGTQKTRDIVAQYNKP